MQITITLHDGRRLFWSPGQSEWFTVVWPKALEDELGTCRFENGGEVSVVPLHPVAKA